MDMDGCLSNLEQNTNVTFYNGIDEPSMLLLPSPLHSLQTLPQLDSSYIETFFNGDTEDNYLNNVNDKSSNECQIKEFSQAIDAYFASIHETESMPIQASSSTLQSSSCSSCCITCCNTCFNYCSDEPCNTCFNSTTNSSFYPPSSLQLNTEKSSNFNPDYRHIQVTCPKFKIKLILADNVCKVKVPWISQVAKQILSAHYSPLSLKSEFISSQTMLDAFESVAVQEVAQAFKSIAFNNPNGDVNLAIDNFFSDPSPSELVSSCEKIRAYRKLSTDDKVTLLSTGLFDFNTIKSVVVYDPIIDGWFYGGKVWSRKWFYEAYPVQVRRLDSFIESFPNFLRNDLNAVAIIYSIVLFNPQSIKLKFRTAVRQERYTYIYLLKRYLTTHYGSECEASDNLYRLMVIIDEISKLRKGTIKFFDHYRSGCSTILENRVAHLVQFKKL